LIYYNKNKTLKQEHSVFEFNKHDLHKFAEAKAMVN